MKNFATSGLMNVLTDTRYALRGLRNAPGYAATAVLTLALGLGAATAMLGVIDSVLLRPVALPHPEQLVTLVRGDKTGEQGNFSFEQLDVIRKSVPGFASVLAYVNLPKPVRTANGARISLTMEVSPNFFRVLGASAHRGRIFTENDKNPNVAVVSHAFWRDNLHSDAGVIGTSIAVYGRAMTVIGVMPEGFDFPPQTFDAPLVVVPISLDAKSQDYNGFVGGQAIARLRSGTSLSVAQDQLRAVFVRNKWGGHNNSYTSLRSYQSSITGDERPALLALLGACVLLLLIACANTANLQIARGTVRAGEMNMRAALGASRG
jgi:hypothetical protein